MTMTILGVSVPERLVTPTIRETDWSVELIHSTADINPRWIGHRVSQVSPALIKVIWNIDTELGLLERRHNALRSAQETADAEGDDRYIGQLLLGDLRYLFLLDCLLSNGR